MNEKEDREERERKKAKEGERGVRVCDCVLACVCVKLKMFLRGYGVCMSELLWTMNS